VKTLLIHGLALGVDVRCNRRLDEIHKVLPARAGQLGIVRYFRPTQNVVKQLPQDACKNLPVVVEPGIQLSG
jgi:hypothetical protein